MVEFEVVTLPEIDHVDTGDLAPDFTRPLVNEEYWEDTSLSELTASGPVMLVFHPMDGAFPATYIWNEINAREWGDRIEVIGVAISTPYDHKRFIRERGIEGYRLFSDPANGVAAEYGIVNDLDDMAGITEPRPAVYLIDTDRTVRYAWVAEEWPDFPPYDEIDTALDQV